MHVPYCYGIAQDHSYRDYYYLHLIDDECIVLPFGSEVVQLSLTTVQSLREGTATKLIGGPGSV